MNNQIQLKASQALDFLRQHPAYNIDGNNSIFDGLYFFMVPCCKNNISESAGKHGIDIFYSPKKYKKYKEFFDKEHTKYPDDWKYTRITVPYKTVYNESWVYDHMEYWYETSLTVFTGNPYSLKDNYNNTKWLHYCGLEGGAKTFEDMLIQMASKTKKIFGNFNRYDDFYIEEEKKDFKTFSAKEFIQNIDKEIIRVYPGLKNLRWLKWFMTTDYAIKHYKEYFDEWNTYIKKVNDLEPIERKQQLEKYKN